MPPRAILHTLLLFKRPPLTPRFVKRVLGNEEREASEEDYLNALEKLGLLKEEGAKREGDPVKMSEVMAEKLKNAFKERVGSLGGYLVLGGLETVGRGVVKLEFIEECLEKLLALGPSSAGGRP